MSTSIDHLVSVHAPTERRFYPRVTPSVPIYVAFGPNNLGTLLNVSENGFQVVTPNRLELNSVYRVFLSLDGISSTINVSVRTIWTVDPQNSSGIQLLDLSEGDREQIRKWVALQNSQNDGLEELFPPKNVQPPAAVLETPSPSVAEPLPQAGDPKIKPEFPPMPLPIHGEFSYQPPSDREKKMLLHRERAARAHSRSSALPLLLWTIFMSAICVATGWSFRHKLSDLFLHRPPQTAQVAEENGRPADNSPGVAMASPAPSDVSSSTVANSVLDDANKNADYSRDAGSNPRPATSTAKVAPPVEESTGNFAPNETASERNSDSLSSHTIQPAAPDVSHSYISHSDLAVPVRNPQPLPSHVNPPEVPEVSHAYPSHSNIEAAPVVVANNSGNAARVPAPETAPAPVASNAPAPAPAINTVNNTAPPPPAPSQSAPGVPRRSAIVGSILDSSRSSDASGFRSLNTVPASAPSVSNPAAAPRANSFAARTSNASTSANPAPAPANPAVIRMDVPEPSVIEVTPPKSLRGGMTTSYVNLPGERVLRSGPLTLHMERSVRVPGDRIPGERWLWHGQKKVVLGELTSRVDPQLSQQSAPYGSITVLATIDKGGYVTNIEPLNGTMAFLPNVAAAIREWRYQPTYLDNKPVDTQAQIEIDFHPAAARAR
jgi:hypothetical protein